MSDTAQKREQGPSISVPVDQELLARVKSAAERQHRSVANFARIALAKELERQGQEASA
jgi:predicted transcriptional regulator